MELNLKKLELCKSKTCTLKYNCLRSTLTNNKNTKIINPIYFKETPKQIEGDCKYFIKNNN